MLSHPLKGTGALPGAAILLAACLAAPEAQLAEIAEPPAVEWAKTFGEPEQCDCGLYVGEATDGSLIILSERPSQTQSRAHITKTDAQGNPQWSRDPDWMFLPHSFGGTKPLCTTRDGGFAALGLEDGYWVSDVYRFDRDGQLIWKQTTETFASGKPVPLLAIQEALDGNLIICGCHGEDVRALLLKMDQATGQVIWWKRYGEELPHPPTLDSIFFFVEPTTDGGFVACGSHDLGYGYLVKTDVLGNIEWSRTLADEQLGALNWVHQTQPGSYFMFGLGMSALGYLLGTDAGGNVQFIRTPFDVCGLSHCIPATPRDGAYIFIGSSTVGLRKIDGLGNEMWSSPAEFPCSISSVQATEDGACVVTGSTAGAVCIVGPASKQDIYLAKLAPESVAASFQRGQTNGDGKLDLTDPVCLLKYLFGSPDDPCKSVVPGCLDAADANDDGKVGITDGIYILLSLFQGGPALPGPSGECGPDPTPDELACVKSTGCP